MLRLYDSRLSGNSWKIRILLNQLGLPYERVTLNLEKGEAAAAEFRVKSRFGRVPVLELDDGRTLVESGAIMLHLAQGTHLMPEDAYLRSEVTSWILFEQGDLQRALALPRVYHLRGLVESMAQQMARFYTDGYLGLEKLDRWLYGRDWLVGDGYTVADLAVYGYVSLASEGGYNMENFASIKPWLERVKQQPGWIPMLHGE